MMPVMDSVAAIRTLKHINPQVKVIAGTGLGSHAKLDAVSALGVKLFVLKPYTAETLLRKLEIVLAEKSEHSN
jgi:two-component system, cell cycle sensor histidine kinase and response regulator CckA